jgi:hypothetical protein
LTDGGNVEITGRDLRKQEAGCIIDRLWAKHFIHAHHELSAALR